MFGYNKNKKFRISEFVIISKCENHHSLSKFLRSMWHMVYRKPKKKFLKNHTLSLIE